MPDQPPRRPRPPGRTAASRRRDEHGVRRASPLQRPTQSGGSRTPSQQARATSPQRPTAAPARGQRPPAAPAQARTAPREQQAPRPLVERSLLHFARTVLPGGIILFGVLVAIFNRSIGLEIGSMFVSAGVAVWLLNFLYRLGVEGDKDRAREEAARRFFTEHGYWPGERPRGR